MTARRTVLTWLAGLSVWLGAGLATDVGPALAQQPVYRIAIMSPATPLADLTENGDTGHSAFLRELRALGYVEGVNLVVDRRAPTTARESLEEAAREIVALEPDAILAATTNMVRRLQELTTTIPIVSMTANPVETGLVPSLARPGGNVTGIDFSADVEFNSRRVQMLQEIVPGLTRIAYLHRVSSNGPGVTEAAIIRAAEAQGLSMFSALMEDPIDDRSYRAAFARIVEERVQAVIVGESPFARTYGPLVAELAKEAGIPVLYPFEETTRAGGLISYGIDTAELYRLAAGQVDKILRGTNPANIPIEQPLTFRLVINLRTAEELHLTIPTHLLLLANDLLE
jgi:putative ABC transport system substrate-binding protein